jgi:hypothetical protein
MNTIVRSLKKNHLIAFVILILSAGNIFGQDSVPGTALNFDGVDDYINCGNPANLSFPGTAPFTLEAWVKPAVNNISGDIITKFNLNVEGEYSLTIRNGKASTHREAPPYNISGTTLLKQDTWYHIASVYDGANLSIYLNGNLENSASSGAITARSTSVIIGAEKQSDNPAVFFNGQIDEVRVWNVARTVEEIREKMAFTLEGWEPGLVSYWQFNEGSGTNAIDPLKGNNGVLINMNDSAWVTSTVPINLFTFYEGFNGISYCSTAWGDYDNDGDLDILLTGGATVLISRIYRNDSGTFTNIDAGLEPVYQGSVAWGDYDNDGDLDILLTGWCSDGDYISSIYRNDLSADGQERVFLDINAGLIGVGYSSVAWGDYDNDGDLDVLLTGVDMSARTISRIYRNDPSADGLDRVFTDINAGLIGVKLGSAAWGDYDKDGDLDILLSGYASDGYYISKIYRNNSVVSNTAPFSPDGLSSTISADSLSFFWNKASDNETPQDGLSYNLIIGNAEYDVFMKSPMADINNGYRTIPAFGNAGQLTSWTYQTQGLFSFFQVIPPDYWGVQAIDHSFAGSALVTDSINIPVSYLPTLNNNIMQPTDLLYWQIQMGDSVTSYQVQIDEDSLFNSCEVNDTLNVSISGSGYYYAIPLQDLARGDVLVAGTKYYWRIKPNYTFGLPTAFTKPAPSFHYMFVTDIDESAGKTIPEKFALHQNYPNPFNPVTTIGFSIARTEHVNLTIFNVKGQEMMTLVDESMAPGSYKAQIDARTWPSGLYFYQLTAGGKQMVKRMILMK